MYMFENQDVQKHYRSSYHQFIFVSKQSKRKPNMILK